LLFFRHVSCGDASSRRLVELMVTRQPYPPRARWGSGGRLDAARALPVERYRAMIAIPGIDRFCLWFGADARRYLMTVLLRVGQHTGADEAGRAGECAFTASDFHGLTTSIGAAGGSTLMA
jgi:hypothetical protein